MKGFQILNRGVRPEAFIVEQTSPEYFMVLVEEEWMCWFSSSASPITSGPGSTHSPSPGLPNQGLEPSKSDFSWRRWINRRSRDICCPSWVPTPMCTCSIHQVGWDRGLETAWYPTMHLTSASVGSSNGGKDVLARKAGMSVYALRRSADPRVVTESAC